MEKSFHRIRPISRLDKSTYKSTKLENFRIESCLLVNAANDSPQKRMPLPFLLPFLPFFNRFVESPTEISSALFLTREGREVWKNCRSKVSHRLPSIDEDDARLKNCCELRKNFEANTASQFQFYFSRMKSGVYLGKRT